MSLPSSGLVPFGSLILVRGEAKSNSATSGLTIALTSLRLSVMAGTAWRELDLANRPNDTGTLVTSPFEGAPPIESCAISGSVTSASGARVAITGIGRRVTLPSTDVTMLAASRMTMVFTFETRDPDLRFLNQFVAYASEPTSLVPQMTFPLFTFGAT